MVMMQWFFFRPTKYAGLADQEQAARSIDYGDRLSPSRHWLGAHPLASRGRCKQVSSLVGALVSSGDTLWVHDIHCLGSNIPRILDVLSLCHDAAAPTEIYTLGYDDTEDTGHYCLLYTALDEMSDRSRRSFKPKKKPGRKSRGISYDTLTPAGRNVIDHYLRRDRVYTLDSALQALQGETADGGSLGRNTFYRIINEQKKRRYRRYR